MTSNRLDAEESPYLRQHKDNPVWWYPWGEEAFARARDEHKPIFLSVGYATCHWCHVMAHESFEDEEVARVLNRHFVSIKVDREEHPDVDQVYMTALQAMGRSGGWPMSVVLTPDLKPFFAGTYFPKQVFLSILHQVADAWSRDPGQLLEMGNLFHQRIAQLSQPFRGGEWEGRLALEGVVDQFWERFDSRHGGFGAAPKFPPTSALRLLLRLYHRDRDARALEMVETTLDRMARGGIYDHLGGGFARYATDDQWIVPHFEKMLYDNALLTTTFLEAFQVTGKRMYAQVARETLDYVLEVMGRPGGGFYSAEDADSEGGEGRFYLWRLEELERILSPEAFRMVCDVYEVTAGGNFDGGSILHLSHRHAWDVKSHPLMQEAHARMRAVRNTRARPFKDDKVLAGWNGLMISAMALGYRVLADARYLEAARAAARFVLDTLVQNGGLLRRYRDGDARLPGTLEDYAYVIHGLLDLYETDFDPEWLNRARALQVEQDRRFWDREDGGYFFASHDTPALLARFKDHTDGATPNPNGCSALNLLRLHRFFRDDTYLDRARRVMAGPGHLLEQAATAFLQLVLAGVFMQEDVIEVAILTPVGKGPALSDEAVSRCLARLWAGFLPHKVVAVGEAAGPGTERGAADGIPFLAGKTLMGGSPTLYVCEGTHCLAPTTDLEAAVSSLHGRHGT